MIKKTQYIHDDHAIIKIPQPVFLELFACCYAGHEIAVQNNAQQAFCHVHHETKKAWNIGIQTWYEATALIKYNFSENPDWEVVDKDMIFELIYKKELLFRVNKSSQEEYPNEAVQIKLLSSTKEDLQIHPYTISYTSPNGNINPLREIQYMAIHEIITKENKIIKTNPLLIADIDEIKQVAKQWLEVVSTGEVVSITEITGKYVRENYLAENQIYAA